MNANDIYLMFKEKWCGTEDELDTALDAFYADIRSSFDMAGDGDLDESILATVDSYVQLHYLI
jgi:hypothetical protein